MAQLGYQLCNDGTRIYVTAQWPQYEAECETHGPVADGEEHHVSQAVSAHANATHQGKHSFV